MNEHFFWYYPFLLGMSTIIVFIIITGFRSKYDKENHFILAVDWDQIQSSETS